MYELTKQKSRGFDTLGIIIFAFLSAVLKMAFYQRPTTLNDDLIKAANGSISMLQLLLIATRFDYANALSGNVFQYNYTIMNVNTDDVDTIRLKAVGKELMLQRIKENPKSSFIKENNVEIQLRYSDENAKYIASISIFPNEY